MITFLTFIVFIAWAVIMISFLGSVFLEDGKVKHFLSKMSDYIFLILFILIFSSCVFGIIYCLIKLRFLTAIKLIYLQLRIENTVTDQNEQYTLYLILMLGLISTMFIVKPIDNICFYIKMIRQSKTKESINE